MADKTKIKACVLCHVGCERANNEDNFNFNGQYMSLSKMDAGAFVTQEFDDACMLFAICDGMGGGEMGERASYLAAKSLNEFKKGLKKDNVQKRADEYLAGVSDLVHGGDKAERGYGTVQGTTLAMVTFIQDTMFLMNVGDSRVYRLRGSQFEQLSYDHSEVNEQVRAGRMTREQARKSPRNNVITHYIGMSRIDRTPDFVYQSRHTVQPDDRIMLCSDGICDLMSDARLEQLLRQQRSPREAARVLMNEALVMGGKDNATVIVLDIL